MYGVLTMTNKLGKIASSPNGRTRWIWISIDCPEFQRSCKECGSESGVTIPLPESLKDAPDGFWVIVDSKTGVLWAADPADFTEDD